MLHSSMMLTTSGNRCFLSLFIPFEFGIVMPYNKGLWTLQQTISKINYYRFFFFLN